MNVKLENQEMCLALTGMGGMGVPGLPKLFGSLFYSGGGGRGSFAVGGGDFFIMGTIGGITRALCVIFLQFIGFFYPWSPQVEPWVFR